MISEKVMKSNETNMQYSRFSELPIKKPAKLPYTALLYANAPPTTYFFFFMSKIFA